jgi:hypothetical protein
LCRCFVNVLFWRYFWGAHACRDDQRPLSKLNCTFNKLKKRTDQQTNTNTRRQTDRQAKMMTESLLDRIEMTAVAKPGAIELSVKVDSTGCTDLRRIHNLFSNHGNPAWPQVIEVIYGWRGLSKDLRLKSTTNKGTADYTITNDDLYEMNLLDPPFYVKDVVNVRVTFSEDVVIHSMPFRIGSSSSSGGVGGSTTSSKDGISHDSLLQHDDASQVSFANDGNNSSSHGGGGSSWGHTMARAWASNDGSQHGGTESEFDEEVCVC